MATVAPTPSPAPVVTDNNPAQTQANNQNFSQANANVFSGSSTPTVMTPGQAFGNTSTPVPTVSPQDTSSGIVGGANQTLQQITDSLTPAQTPLDQENQGILNDIASLTGQDANKGADTLAAQQAAGVDQKQQDLTNATNELATKTASYQQLQANLGGNGSVETSAILAAQNSGLLKAQAADIGITNAKITAAQGNLSLAQQQVTDAINLKYSTIESQIATKQAQLAAIAPQLSAEQKTQALAQAKVLQDQADQVAQKKADETQIQTIGLQAAQNGASAGVMAAITNATDPNVALQLATPYLAKAQTQVVEVNGHSLLIDSQTGKTLQDLGVSNSVIQANIAHGGAGGGGGGSIVDPTTDAGVKAIIAANPGEYGHAADAIDAKYGAGTATEYDSQLRAVYNNGQSVDSAFASTSTPKLTNSQTVSVRAANTALNNSNTGKAMQNASTAYSNIQSIDPTTTDPNLQQQALLNLSQLEFPGTNSARGLLTVNVGSAQNSDFANALIAAQKILQAKGSLAPGVIQKLQSQATTIYNNVKSSYDSNLNANASSLAKTIGISQTQAKALLTNYDNSSSSQSQATVVDPSQVPSGYYQASDGLFYKK